MTKSIKDILTEMVLLEIVHVPSDVESIRDALSDHVELVKQFGLHKDTDGHNIATINGKQLHYTGNIDNLSDMTLFRKHPHGGFEQTYILKGTNGVRGGISRNLNKMLDDGHVVYSSGMHSSDAIKYYTKLMQNSPHIAFSKYNFVTKEHSPINDYKEAFDGDPTTTIRMTKRG